MKTIFDIIKDINEVKDTSYQLSSSDDFRIFLVMKYLSFISPEYCNLINLVINEKSFKVMDDQMEFDFLKKVLPKRHVGFIKYMKKPLNKEDSKHDNICATLAQNLNLSKKEIRMMTEIIPDLLEQFEEEDIKQYKKIDKRLSSL